MLSFGKILLLSWLRDSPATGYQLMKKYEALFGRASPGTVYPLLTQLSSRGLVSKKNGLYVLTEKGRKALDDIRAYRDRYVKELKAKVRALATLLGDDVNVVPTERARAMLAEMYSLAGELGEEAEEVLRDALERMRAIRESRGK